jgi:protein-L-isoaspartate O-methyltransferase
MPRWARAHPRSVTVRGAVTAAGRVDTMTALVDDPSDERYVEAAMNAVARMRFVPAEFDGLKVPAPIEIVIPFGETESAEEPAAP